MLFKTIITIECGEDLSRQFKIPLGFLCEQSQKQVEVFWEAEDLRKRYAKVKALGKRVNAVFPLLELHGIRHTEKCREKAMALILESLNDFPLPTYEAGVAQKLAEATDAVFRKNDLFLKPPGKKFDRLQFPKNDVKGRLRQLHDEAVYAVFEQLRFYLHRLKDVEAGNASKSAVKAAAQQRVLLPKEEPATVEALVEWLYKNGLSFVDVNHLFGIHALADKLGIASLAAECMDLLSTATSRILCRAKAEGLSLKGLLEEGARGDEQLHDPDANDDPLSSSRVVAEVFKATLNTPNPPAVLQKLVADAIAASEDDALLNRLLPIMNLDMRGKVTMAMLRNVKAKAAAEAHREMRLSHVSSEASRSASIKSETSYGKDQGVKQAWGKVLGPASATETATGYDEEADSPAAD
ncbi:hypothetical protein P171DRAFT_396549 [Karstenula rhodostoma CBS 690.94]|uniref:Uncharacterized protein n=1 Tax=Karstenula rhodostoma CBS 690.94 TaxID=1392251 RepID=A0A9P4P8S6_9PLEO|nr:hypothetical protein P171DRAFT_396549 [Karstenula rhodostoma CBS 690.94]